MESSMTIINRALHKAYKRRAESEPVPELKRPGSASVSGWASKLREPIRPLNRPAAITETVLPAGAPVPVDAGHSPAEPSVEAQAEPLVEAQAEPPVDAPVEAQAEPPIEAQAKPPVEVPVETQSNPASAVPPPQDQAAPAEPWSWPPIVQRLLTCPAAAELRDLAVQLRALAAGNDLRCVAFSGPGRKVGRTSLVLTLASVLIADKKTRVAIVDADLSHPDAAQLISLQPAVGLEEAIDNSAADYRGVTTLIAGRLAIVPLARPVAAEAIDSRRIGAWQTFLRSLRREYDLVLVDAGPWETARLPLVLECRAVDAVVCICRANSSREDSAEEANFRQPGVEWLGVIETFTQAQQLDSRHD
jgi:Mrp family chromosome partitioning ATPase